MHIWIKICYFLVSLPAWECGLKFFTRRIWQCENKVTPCVGVWIEIRWVSVYSKRHICHSLRGSVDWNYPARIWQSGRYEVTPCVGVWIEITLWMARQTGHCCHSLRGSVDWNLNAYETMNRNRGHSLRGSVDWNYEPTHAVVSNPLVTPCVGVWIEIKT